MTTIIGVGAEKKNKVLSEKEVEKMTKTLNAKIEELTEKLNNANEKIEELTKANAELQAEGKNKDN